MEKNIKELIDREFSCSKGLKISKIYQVNKDVNDILPYIIGMSTLSTFKFLLKTQDLNAAVNCAINEARCNSKYISLLETFTPREWLTIARAAIGLNGLVSQPIENGRIDFLNLGNMNTSGRGM